MRTLPYITRLVVCLVLFPVLSAAASFDAPEPPQTVEQVSPPAPDASSEPLPAVVVTDGLPSVATVDLTVPADDVWQRVRRGFAMPDLTSELVLEWQTWYLSRPEQLKKIAERSRRYLYHIVEELEKRGMPTELALLPMVESAYNPMAYSPARAAGIWQFIPSTGKTFRLEQNWWVDQRRDIVASTSAALEYLQQIYEMHGDWHLALASYNWGENAVARAIAKNKAAGLPTDYQSLTMPQETRNYVPKLQALKNIISRPDLFNFKLETIPNEPYFVTVEKPADMDVAVAAKLAEMSLEEFISLNPAYRRPVIPAKERTSIVLPVDKAEAFHDNLENHGTPLLSWRTYTLKKGERIERVAERFGISPVRLRHINGLNPKLKFAAGQTLLVPAKGNTGTADLMKVNLAEVQVDANDGRDTRESRKQSKARTALKVKSESRTGARKPSAHKTAPSAAGAKAYRPTVKPRPAKVSAKPAKKPTVRPVTKRTGTARDRKR